MDNRDSYIDKVPFYMTFPMQNLYVMEMEYERDIERMKALYPNEVSSILAEVEKRCDELEYEGSRIFDEEPDKQEGDEHSQAGKHEKPSRRKIRRGLCNRLKAPVQQSYHSEQENRGETRENSYQKR